jgi:hypothetical protein
MMPEKGRNEEKKEKKSKKGIKDTIKTSNRFN